LSKFIRKKQVVDTALNVVRITGQKAIDFASSKLTPNSQQILSKIVSSTPTQLSTSRVNKGKVTTLLTNLNNLIAGLGQRAIKIQDIMK